MVVTVDRWSVLVVVKDFAHEYRMQTNVLHRNVADLRTETVGSELFILKLMNGAVSSLFLTYHFLLT